MTVIAAPYLRRTSSISDAKTSKKKLSLVMRRLILAVCFVVTLYVLGGLDDDDDGMAGQQPVLAETIIPTAKRQKQMIPTQQEFQSIYSTGNKNQSSYEEAQFVYANRTYTYRFSTKLLEKSKQRMQTTDKSDQPAVVFGICANSKKPIRREAIRKSWALDAVLALYLVAGPWENVAAEFRRSGDLLWIDVAEDYRRGLTPKTFGFVHFASQQLDAKFRLNFDFIFKTDDDVYANVTHIGRELMSTQVSPPIDYYGLFKNGSTPVRERTDEDGSKWFLSREIYAPDFFPPYAPGVGYALSRRFASCGAHAMASIPQMPWEDVATGLLAESCQVSLTAADENWSHFNPEGKGSTMEVFPYDTYVLGDQLIKIVHKVAPWYFLPMYQRKPLWAARAKAGRRRRESGERRKNRGKELQKQKQLGNKKQR